MFPYKIFYRKYGIRRLGLLTTPQTFGLEDLRLPRDSLIHHRGSPSDNQGMSRNDPLLEGGKKVVYVNHITQMSGKRGKPRPRKGVMINSVLLRYRSANKLMRPLQKDISEFKDDRTFLVENYAFLYQLWTYPTLPLAAYNAWHNIQDTVWANVERIASVSDRHQFLVMELPEALPSLQELNRADKGESVSELKAFTSTQRLDLLNVYRWLGDKGQKLSTLSQVSRRNLGKVNLILTYKGAWTVVNLGMLSSWRYDEAAEMAGEETGNLEGTAIQRRFLRCALAIFDAGTDSVPAQTTIVDDSRESETDDEVKSEEGVKRPGFSSRSTGRSRLANMKLRNDLAKVEIDSDFEEEGFDKLFSDMDGVKPPVPVEEDPTDEVIPPIDEDLDALFDQVELKDEDETPLLHEDGEASVPTPEKVVDDPFADSGTYTAGTVGLTDTVEERCMQMVEAGAMSGAQYNRFMQLSESYKKLKSPFDPSKTIEEEMKVTAKDLKVSDDLAVKDIATVFDKSMMKSSIDSLDKDYVKNTMHKDILNAIMGIQRQGIAVTDIQMEVIEDLNNKYEAYTVKVVPVQGSPSTLNFKIPVVEEDGTFMVNGVKQRYRKQRVDLPIRKTSATEVALTSSHAKLFIERTPRATFNYERWLVSRLTAMALDEEVTFVSSLKTGNVFDAKLRLPLHYTMLSRRIRQITIDGYKLCFDYAERSKVLGEEGLAIVDGLDKMAVLVGKKQNRYVYMTENNELFATIDGKESVSIGTVASLAGLEESAAPVPAAFITVFNKPLSLAAILIHEMGLGGLLKYLKAEYRVVDSGKRMNMTADEYRLIFKDKSLILKRSDIKTALILSGLKLYQQELKHQRLEAMDDKDTLHVILERSGIGLRYLREFDIIYRLFLDDITIGLLKDMKEPTNMVDLFIRSAELLSNDEAPKETEMQRYRGYEQMTAALTTELTSSIRVMNAKFASARVKLDLNPEAVWYRILNNPVVLDAADRNPIDEMKQHEAVTFSGHGGRSGRSLVARTRMYQEKDLGVISESTSDSSDAGSVTYLAHNPGFENLRGVIKDMTLDELGLGNLISPSALLAPQSMTDDPKRVNFISIQQSQGVHCVGGTATPLRTGMEVVVAHRTGDLYSFPAEEDGIVTGQTDTTLTVTYKSGKQKSIEMGRRYGKAAGVTVAHDLTTDMAVGQPFKKGDIIAYNRHYFEPDQFNKNQVNWKAGVLTKVAFADIPKTYEDACLISRKTAEQLGTVWTEVRTITARFDQTLANPVKVGSEVDVETILCTIHESLSSDTPLFDEQALATLEALAAQTPRAKYKGTVERITVLYNGDKEDMSPSVLKLVNESDRRLAAVTEKTRGKRFNGQVDGTLRIEGKSLERNTVAIQVYITGILGFADGDKAVIGNQMKTICSGVFDQYVTEIGEEIGAVFSYSSVLNRIIPSAESVGTTNTLLLVIGKRMAEIYRGTRNE